MGFPQRIDDEEFLAALDEAQDEYWAEQRAKQAKAETSGEDEEGVTHDGSGGDVTGDTPE